MMKDLDESVRRAVRAFWRVRDRQARAQGAKSGQRDRGGRTAATGGAQMEGFETLVRSMLVESGVPDAAVFSRKRVELPGFFRAEKRWDLLVVLDDRLVAIIEFKSHVGPSFGNNCNNRVEEALGSATDLWAAYREGAFKPSVRPWLGYLMLLEETPGSMSPVRPKEPHFDVFPEFKEASYADRYELLLTKLVRERLYDGACFLLSTRPSAGKFSVRELSPELAFRNFATSLLGRATAAFSSP